MEPQVTHSTISELQISLYRMSYRLPISRGGPSVDVDGSSASDSDDGVSDWASTLGEALVTKSLFDETLHPTPEAALRHDEERWEYALDAEVKRLDLDEYGRIRLVNLARKVGFARAFEIG